ncbi:hypothetical protein ONS95_013644 [Cadophora gregata]|uniref:uncharacterized protein n=1 Tax=Cadophora gregata TaxID=51156 RepID=UPI0026DCA661|nr:uncharacterized protein ONS95_013644 [Cadophora gregata]KAK0113388.1 hypothetical protein ONS96_014254 [Cadophora gregata f. sp. sojae]KAK0114142.1 hypothetical protein ONS95_013644 [Cadophora gregata]
MALKSYTAGEWIALFTLHSTMNPDFPQPGAAKVLTTSQALLEWIREGFPWTGELSRQPTDEALGEMVECWRICGFLRQETDSARMFGELKQRREQSRRGSAVGWFPDADKFSHWIFVYGARKNIYGIT